MTKHHTRLNAKLRSFFEEELTSQTRCVVLPAIDWGFLYNQIWQDFNFGIGEKMCYYVKWDRAMPAVRYTVSKPGDNVSISTCWNKTLHDQIYLKLLKSHEETEMSFCFQSIDESSDEEDWPIP